MKLNTTDFRRKLQHPLLLAFASVPLTLLLSMMVTPTLLDRAWIFPAAYVLLGWGCILLPGRRRVLGGIVSIAAMIGLSVWLLRPVWEVPLALLPLMYAVLIIITLPIGGWPRNQEMAMGWHVGGVLTHVLMQLMISMSQRVGANLYDAGQLPLLVSFLCYAVLVLLALNRASLDSAAQSRRTVPLLMRRQNIVITMALLVIGVLIAAIPAIGSALGVLWDWIMRGVAFIAGLIAMLMPQKSATGGAPASSGDMDMGFGEAAPPSQFALIMEKIIGIVALIVLIVLLIVAVRALSKKLYRLMKYLWGRLGQYGAAASEDYEDEITSTRDESDTEREGLLTRLRRVVPADEKGLTPTQQVRSRYRRLKQRRRWDAAATARETLPSEPAVLYERARYSGQELSAEEAERFQAGTKKL